MIKILKINAIKMITALSIVGALSGGFLVLVYNYSTPRIEANIKSETKKAIEEIFPSASKIQKIQGEEIFSVTGAKGQLEGYAFLAEGNGYQGTIKLIAGVDPSIEEMKGMAVLESQETPGLGAEINEKYFRDQFNGLEITHKIEYVKNQKPANPYEIEAITGATISSRAVVNILNKAITEVSKTIKGKK